MSNEVIDKIINEIEAYAIEIKTNDYDDYDKNCAAQECINHIMKILQVRIN